MATDASDSGLTGLSGWAADVVDEMGEVGLGLLVAVENVFPPIPSEPVLTLSGVLAQQGTLSLLGVLLCATLGSVAGSLVLYAAGARLGRERLVRLVDRIPLADQEDLARAEAWFARHGSAAVFLGRFIPVVRSLVSVPAGLERMPVGRFALLTAAGSGTWNAGFIMLGYLAGESLNLDALSRGMDIAVYVVAAITVALGVQRYRRRRRRV